MTEGAEKSGAFGVSLKINMGDITLQLYEDILIISGSIRKLVDNNFWDSKHQVSGKVVEGLDMVDAISKVKDEGDGQAGGRLKRKGDGLVLSKSNNI